MGDLKDKSIPPTESRWADLLAAILAYRYTVRFDAAGRFTTEHDAECVAITGYSPEEYAADPQLWVEMVFPEDRDQVLRNLAALHAGAEIPPLVHRLIRKDGALRWVRNTMLASRDSVGRVIGYDGLIEDITRAKESEAQLVGAREFAESLVEGAAVIVVGLDQDGRVILWNSTAELMTGYSRQELLGRDWFETVVPRERFGFVWDLFQSWVRGEVHFQGVGQPAFENPIITRSGQERMIAWRNNEMFLQGQRLGLLSVGVDVTDQKLTEEALRRSNAYNRGLLDTSLDPFLMIALDGIILDFNRAAQVLTGLPRNLLARRSCDTLFADQARAHQLCLEAKTIGSVRDAEMELVTVHGNKIPVLINASLFFAEDGQPMGVLATLRDISERKAAEVERARHEANLRELQKLESLGLLAGGIAHDFNNLLVGVLGNAELARDLLPPGSPAKEAIRGIEMAAHRAAALTRQMLALSGRGGFIVSRIDLAGLVQSVWGQLEGLGRPDIVLSVEVEPDLPLLEGDREQVAQLLINLVANAIEALGPAAGKVAIRLGTETLPEELPAGGAWGDPLPAGRYLFLEVADNGGGMDDATLEKVFEPFFSTKTPGRGLGLPAVRGIVRGHHGGIRIHSQIGAGTAVRVLLPATLLMPQDQRGPELERQAPSRRPAEGPVVLVIDGEEMVRSIAAATLTRSGFGVVVSGCGREGFDLIRDSSLKLDVVVADASQSGCTVRLIEEVRRYRQGLPLILTSGFEEDEVTSGLGAHRPHAFLPKPFLPQQLVECVQKVLNRKPGGDASS